MSIEQSRRLREAETRLEELQTRVSDLERLVLALSQRSKPGPKPKS